VRSDVTIIARPGRLAHIECTGGIAARHTAPDTVHLVSAAATPLGGDTIRVRVVVAAGARLRLRSAAATVALPGAVTVESHATWDVEVAGELDLDPEPTVVAGGSHHLTTTRLQLTGPAQVRLRERVQIGRSGERQGFWSGSLHADAEGAPLLRHRVELGTGAIADDALGTPLACISELRYPATSFDGAGLPLELAGGGVLATWQGDRLTG